MKKYLQAFYPMFQLVKRAFLILDYKYYSTYLHLFSYIAFDYFIYQVSVIVVVFCPQFNQGVKKKATAIIM